MPASMSDSAIAIISGVGTALTVSVLVLLYLWVRWSRIVGKEEREKFEMKKRLIKDNIPGPLTESEREMLMEAIGQYLSGGCYDFSVTIKNVTVSSMEETHDDK